MRLVDLENQIKQMVAENPNNPDVFNKLYDLIYVHLKRTKYVNTDDESRNVALLFAEDLYMRILDGFPLQSYLGYIFKVRIKYVKMYRKMYESEVFDINENSLLRETMFELFGNSGTTHRDYMEIDMYDSIDSLISLIDEILEHSCMYESYTSEYLNIRTSIVMSLITGEETKLFVDERLENYFRLMLVRVKEGILEELYKNNVDHVASLIDTISLLQENTFEELVEDTYD